MLSPTKMAGMRVGTLSSSGRSPPRSQTVAGQDWLTAWADTVPALPEYTLVMLAPTVLEAQNGREACQPMHSEIVATLLPCSAHCPTNEPVFAPLPDREPAA